MGALRQHGFAQGLGFKGVGFIGFLGFKGLGFRV